VGTVPRHSADSSRAPSDATRDVAVAPRRRQRRLAEWPIGLVLLGVVCGLVVVATNAFRPGVVLVGSSVVLGTLLRAVLSERRAGLLVVRSRWVDVLTLGTLGIGLTVLALVVPPPEEARGIGVGSSRSSVPAGVAVSP
jgi:hypothetical protein